LELITVALTVLILLLLAFLVCSSAVMVFDEICRASIAHLPNDKGQLICQLTNVLVIMQYI
jgi:hypothetical protein